MPSIGAATEASIYRRIDRMISDRLPIGQRADARQFIVLSAMGGDTTWRFLLIFGIVLSAFAAVVATAIVDGIHRHGLGEAVAITVLCILLAFLCFASSWWMHTRRDAARDRMDALLASDPVRWMPIREKVRDIVIEAGGFPEGQRTRAVTRNK